MTVSKKHGLNPSMDTCFWCGDVKGIALFGKMKGDAEAPRNVFLSYEPCEKCKAVMEHGVTIISVVGKDNGNPPLQDVYPTGKWCVMRREAAKSLFDVDNDKILLAENIYNRLTGGRQK